METPRFKGLIFFDIDGTIIPYGESVPPKEVEEIFCECEKSGWGTCISTGRYYPAALWPFLSVVDKCIFSVHNGARIVYKGVDMIPTKHISPNDVDEIWHWCKEEGYALLLESKGNYFWLGEKFKRLLEITKKQRIDARHIENPFDAGEEIIQVTVAYMGRPCPLAEIQALWGSKYNSFVAGNEIIDICPSDKGLGVQEVCKLFSISPSICHAFGDSGNDIPMLDAVGHPHVMASAKPEVLVHGEICHDLVLDVRGIISP